MCVRGGGCRSITGPSSRESKKERRGGGVGVKQKVASLKLKN